MMRSAGSLQQRKSQRASYAGEFHSPTHAAFQPSYVGKVEVEHMQIFKSYFDEHTAAEIKIQVNKFSFSIERFFHLV